MTEAEYRQHVRQFVGTLEHYPKVGKRPFGDPKGAWLMTSAWATIGFLLQLPLLLGQGLDRRAVVASVFGAFLLGCAFTMRVVAFLSAAGACVDRRLVDRLVALEARLGPAEKG